MPHNCGAQDECCTGCHEEEIAAEKRLYAQNDAYLRAEISKLNLQIGVLRDALLVIAHANPMDNSKAWEHCVNEIHDEANRALKATNPEKRVEPSRNWADTHRAGDDGPPCPQAKDGHRFNKWGVCMRCGNSR